VFLGNPAVVTPRSVRPEALRPRLSCGCAFVKNWGLASSEAPATASTCAPP
jgi:hypothetical protein